jgi:hypothetical protein
VARALLPLEAVLLDHILVQAVMAAITLQLVELVERALQVEVVGQEAMEVIFYLLSMLPPITQEVVDSAIMVVTLGVHHQVVLQVEAVRQAEELLL